MHRYDRRFVNMCKKTKVSSQLHTSQLTLKTNPTLLASKDGGVQKQQPLWSIFNCRLEVFQISLGSNRFQRVYTGLHRSYIIQIPNLFKTLSKLGSSEAQCGAKGGRKKLVLVFQPTVSEED